MSSEFNRRARWFDGGANSRYPLLNSIRRAGYAQRQLEQEREFQGVDPRYPNRIFPDQYREKKGDNRRVLDADQAGVINLGVVTPDGASIDQGFNQEISFGGRLVKPRNGVLRILDHDILGQNFDLINERNKWIDGLAGLCLSDDTGQIARYIIPALEYNLLQSGTGGQGMPSELTSYSGRPEVIANYPPNDPNYTNGVAKLRYVIKLAESSIHFDSDISDLLKKYNLYGEKASSKSSCCC
jgi:hypothetical protein